MVNTKSLLYAIKDGKLIGIDEVPSGLKCNCICPACGESLIARKGDVKAHSFAHKGGTKCTYGYQTSLHMLAKEIISEEKKIFLPECICYFHGSYTNKVVQNEGVFDIHEVRLEKKIDDIIPDILLDTSYGQVIVEIFITHAIDDDKREKIKKTGISTVEIDLSKYDRLISKQDLSDILLNSNENIKWVFHNQQEAVYKKCLNLAERRKIVHRGLASHIDYCPINKRVWNGKPYANYIDDCLYCEYNYGTEGKYIYCAGRD